jgi:hypothetical protein
MKKFLLVGLMILALDFTASARPVRSSPPTRRVPEAASTMLLLAGALGALAVFRKVNK